jgi:hypothetical protein
MMALQVALDLAWSTLTSHFETLIHRPALCNAGACIYGGSRASTRALNPSVEISYDKPT